MVTLALDPGLNGLGCALFRDNELIQAWYSPGAERELSTTRGRDGEGLLDSGPRAWLSVARSIAWLNDDERTRPSRIVVELMKVYPGRAGVGDPNRLLALQAINGAALALFPGALAGGVLARDWKHQVKKDVMTRRIIFWLATRGWYERVLVPGRSPALVHNAIDAAGLGLVALRLEGRLSKAPW